MATYTVTFTLATPAVVGWGTTAPTAGKEVAFITTGALPTGVVAGTSYYVDSPSGNNSNIRTTQQGTTKINTSGSQSGVHTGSIPVGLTSQNPVAANLVKLASSVINIANSPLAVPCSVSNLITGSSVRVARHLDGLEISNGVAAGSTYSFQSKIQGLMDVTVRYSPSVGTRYLEYTTQANITSAGMAVLAQQIIDTTA